MASLEVIDRVWAHPNADLLDLVLVLDFQCVVTRGSATVGQRVVFIEPDYSLPADQSWAESFRVRAPRRIREVCLRGEWSRGVVVPLTRFDGHPIAEALAVSELGVDWSAELGVHKVEAAPEGNAHQRRQLPVPLPFHLPATDEVRVERLRKGVGWQRATDELAAAEAGPLRPPTCTTTPPMDAARPMAGSRPGSDAAADVGVGPSTPAAAVVAADPTDGTITSSSVELAAAAPTSVIATAAAASRLWSPPPTLPPSSHGLAAPLLGQLVDVYLKIDGQSWSAYYERTTAKFGVCSRTLEVPLGGSANNAYLEQLTRYPLLRERLVAYCEQHQVSLVLRGESYGGRIQRLAYNPHSHLPPGLALFSVYNLDARAYERKGSPHYFPLVAAALSLPTVPPLALNVAFTPALVREYRTDRTRLDHGVMFEGVVVQGRTFSCKIINSHYDAKKR